MKEILLLMAILGFASAWRIPICNGVRPNLMRKFNVTAFLGHWHAVADYNVQGKAFSTYVEPHDMQALFYRKSDGSLGFKTAAHLTLRLFSHDVTSRCFDGSGRLEIPDPQRGAHWQMAFDTWIPYSPASYQRDYFILGTDYKHYALLYTCWKEKPDGSCDPDYSFSWVLSRHNHGHGHKHMRDIRRAAKQACLDPDSFRDRAGARLCPLKA